MNEFTHFVDDFPIFVYKISTRCNFAQNIRGRLVLENNSLKTISEKEADSIETAPQITNSKQIRLRRPDRI